MRKSHKPWKTITLNQNHRIIDDSIYFDTQNYIEAKNARNEQLGLNDSERHSDDDSDVSVAAANSLKLPRQPALKKTNTAMMDNCSVADEGSDVDDIDAVCKSLSI